MDEITIEGFGGKTEITFEGRRFWAGPIHDAAAWKAQAITLQERAAEAAFRARRATAIAAELERRETAAAAAKAEQRRSRSRTTREKSATFAFRYGGPIR